ncbi:MAG: NUDIX hydrolase [Patescibacteria group bacterium]
MLKRIFNIYLEGSKAIIISGEEVLLIRHNYGSSNWTLPGGRINRNELPEHALVRELQEELGLNVSDQFKFLNKINISDYDKTIVFVFLVKLNWADKEKIELDPIEIKEYQWFKLKELPVLSKVARQMLDCYLNF